MKRHHFPLFFPPPGTVKTRTLFWQVVLFSLLYFYWVNPINAQLTINCPPSQSVSTASNSCNATVNYSQPTTNAVANQVFTFNYTGSVQTFTVPPGANSIRIEVWGAQGARANDRLTTNGQGGLGGYATGTRAVTPGQVLRIYVGGVGNVNGSGGFNGGGNGGSGSPGSGCSGGPAGGGGGASDVRFGGTGLGNRIIVAGGGGGGGRDYCNGTCQPCGCGGGGGGAGGLTGGNAQSGFNCGFNYPGSNINNGRGGTQTAGGTAPPPDGGSGNSGTAGALGLGGIGANGSYDVAGGGGGGGYFGGSGGGGASPGSGVAGGGGGGGSSYIGGVTAASVQSGIRTGHGRIVIHASIPVTITQTSGLPSGATFPLGTTTNSFSVTQAGTTRNCSFTVSVRDNVDPIINCPSNQTVNLNANCRAATPNYVNLASASDNCTAAPAITQSPSAGATLAGPGNQMVTLTATDASGNTRNCTFTVVKVDVTAPSITCPSLTTLPLNSNCTASLPNFASSANATDNCSNTLTTTQSPAAGTSLSGVGSTSVTLTTTDGAGNTNNCTFTVNRVDATAPTINCPANSTVNLNASCQSSVPNYIGMATASDACTASPSITQSPAPGANITGSGLQTITMTATDAAGNNRNCTFTLTAVDAINPNVTCPGNQTVALNANCQVSLSDYTSQANGTDNCTSAPNLAQSPAPGTVQSGTGSQTVTITVTDGAGNTGNCTFTVNRVDQIAPTINCPSNRSINLNANCTVSMPNYAGQASISDNCTSTPTITQTPSAGSLLTGAGTQPVVITAQDAAGNSTNCSFSLTRVDATAPSVTCPSNQSVVLNNNCSGSLPNYVAQATATDNCTSSPTKSQSPAPGTPLNGTGTTTVTITAADQASNNSDCSFTVTAIDQAPPSVICPSNQTRTLNNNCSAQMDDFTILAIGVDNCSSSPSLSQSPTSGSNISGAGPQVVSITATDGSGNASNCSFTVNFVDQIQPVAICPSNATIALNSNCEVVVPSYISQASATDNCTNSPSLSQMPAPGGLFSGGGPHTVTITATDAAGNTGNCTFQIAGIDQVPPTIICPPAQDIPLNANCVGVIPNFLPLALATDNCTASPTKSQSPAPGTIISGQTMSTVTIFTTDASNLQDSCTFVVNTIDITGPTVNCPAADTLYTDSNCEVLLPDYTSVTSNVDNCSSILNLNQVPFGGTTLSGANSTQVVVMSALDQSGNTGTCSLTVSLVDTIAPTFQGCPQSVVFRPVSFNCNPVVQWTAPVSVDACGSPSVSSTHTPGDNFPIGTTTVTYTASDSSGNSSQCQFDVIVEMPYTDGLVSLNDSTPCEGDSVVLTVNTNVTAYNWSTGATGTSTTVQNSGWYWVDLTDASQCTARDSIYVNFNAIPAPVVSISGDSVCTSPFASYQWMMNGNQVPGATGQCFVPGESGSFAVIVTDGNGCSGTSQPLTFVGTTPGNAGPGFAVYPNPARDQLKIRMDHPLLEAGSIRMFDIAGRIVLNRRFEQLDGTSTLDLSGLSDGTYLLEIKSGEFHGRRKVVRIR